MELESIKFTDEYKIVWRKTDNNQIGEVRNYAENNRGYRIIKIMHDEELMKRINMRYIVSDWTEDGPSIYVSSKFIDLDTNMKNSGILHEVGHIHYEHFIKLELDQDEIRERRINAIQNENIMKEEVEADNFAIKKTGKGSMLEFLNYLKSTRPEGKSNGLNDLGKKELELRIARIEALE